MNTEQELGRAVADVRAAFPHAQPTVGLILGSGLGGFADGLTGRSALPFDRISGFPSSTVVGHAGRLVHGRGGEGTATVEVLALQGRAHFYEGHDLERV